MVTMLIVSMLMVSMLMVAMLIYFCDQIFIGSIPKDPHNSAPRGISPLPYPGIITCQNANFGFTKTSPPQLL